MEILFIVLVFFLGFVLGAVTLYYVGKWVMNRQMKKMMAQMQGGNPMALLDEMIKQVKNVS